jgi:hypothetical protein
MGSPHCCTRHYHACACVVQMQPGQMYRIFTPNCLRMDVGIEQHCILPVQEGAMQVSKSMCHIGTHLSCDGAAGAAGSVSGTCSWLMPGADTTSAAPGCS